VLLLFAKACLRYLAFTSGKCSIKHVKKLVLLLTPKVSNGNFSLIEAAGNSNSTYNQKPIIRHV